MIASSEASALTQYECERCKTRFVLAPRNRQLSLGEKMRAFSTGLGGTLRHREGLRAGYDAARRKVLAKMEDEAYQSFIQGFHFCHGCRRFVCNDCWTTQRHSCLTCVARSMTNPPGPQPPSPLEGPEIPKPVVEPPRIVPLSQDEWTYIEESVRKTREIRRRAGLPPEDAGSPAFAPPELPAAPVLATAPPPVVATAPPPPPVVATATAHAPTLATAPPPPPVVATAPPPPPVVATAPPPPPVVATATAHAPSRSLGRDAALVALALGLLLLAPEVGGFFSSGAPTDTPAPTATPAPQLVTPILSCSSDTTNITCSVTNSGVYPAGAAVLWEEDSLGFGAGSWSASYPDDAGSHTFRAYVTAAGYIDSSPGSATYP